MFLASDFFYALIQRVSRTMLRLETFPPNILYRIEEENQEKRKKKLKSVF